MLQCHGDFYDEDIALTLMVTYHAPIMFQRDLLQKFWSASWILTLNILFLDTAPMKHCTMRLSIELENFQILKSKRLVFAQFGSKYDNSSAAW